MHKTRKEQRPGLAEQSRPRTPDLLWLNREADSYGSAIHFEENKESVASHINKCTENVTVFKCVSVGSNKLSWLTVRFMCCWTRQHSWSHVQITSRSTGKTVRWLSCSMLQIHTIIPVIKKSSVPCLHDLTLVIMKCFKRLVMTSIKSSLCISLKLVYQGYRVLCPVPFSIPTGYEVQLAVWCCEKNLALIVDKTKKMVTDHFILKKIFCFPSEH